MTASTNAAANARAEVAAAAQKLAAEKAARVKQEKEAAAAAAAAAAAEKVKRDRDAKAKQAVKAVEQTKKSTTISLFGLGGNNADTVSISPPRQKQPSPAKPTAPSGVPTISGWRLTGDGSISGRISGSPNFRDGEQVTTSQIVQGRIESGSVVKTGSGSRYFLA